MISRPTISLLSAVLFLAPSVFSLDLPLSSESIREAYFLGQRRDDRTFHFFDSYRKRLPDRKSGSYVSTVEFFTPYAQAVERSLRHAPGYSAQQAEHEYRARTNTVRVAVQVRYAVLETRGREMWKDLRVQLSQDGKILEPLTSRYQGTSVGTGQGWSTPTGFILWLEYDAGTLSSSDVTIDSFFADGQNVVATFDLDRLR